MILSRSHMHFAVGVSWLDMNLFSAPFSSHLPPAIPSGSNSKSVPTVMHLKVNHSTPTPPRHPGLLHPLRLHPDKLRCCNALSDLIFPLELWLMAERAGGAGECPEIIVRD